MLRFTLKSQKIFSARHTTPKKLKTQQSPIIVDLCLRKTRAGNILMIWTSSCFIEVFFFLNKTQSPRFLKIPFSCRISVDARPSLGNKDASSNSLGVV